MKPCLIIQPGQKLATMAHIEGDFDHWMLKAMGKSPDSTEVVYPHRGDALPDGSQIQAAIVTGSGAMVSDTDDWIAPLSQWLRDFAAQQKPLMGICFGHQILAHALGGQVDVNPAGVEVGTVATRLTDAALDDALFANLPAKFPVQASHLQSVIQLPPGAVRLSASDQDANHVFRLGASVYGVQFHPEFDCAITRCYVERWSDKLAERGVSLEETLTACQETPFGVEVLRRFGRYWR